MYRPCYHVRGRHMQTPKHLAGLRGGFLRTEVDLGEWQFSVEGDFFGNGECHLVDGLRGQPSQKPEMVSARPEKSRRS